MRSKIFDFFIVFVFILAEKTSSGFQEYVEQHRHSISSSDNEYTA
jgi:hypothetical protein